MECALQHPEFGYSRHHNPLGAAGDFITAPEISQMFGELLGLWCVDWWQRAGRPTEWVLCECGPGRGTLLHDALRAARQVPAFLAACQLRLFETNHDLRALQAQALGAYQPQWLARLDDLPPLPTLVLANEFFDALPIRQFSWQASGWHENCIGVVADRLAWLATPVLPSLGASFPAGDEHGGGWPPGAVFETTPAGHALMAILAQHIVAYGGALLAIDYGYAAPSGAATFQAVAQHHATDPLADPGAADLTAHVDFGALAAVAVAHQAHVWPLQTQGDFLTKLGIAQRCHQLAQPASEAQRVLLQAALHRLTDPAEMGTLFKVLCVTPTALPVPAGWE